MGAVRKLQKSAAALKGITVHDGFLGDETLLQLVNGPRFESIRSRHSNDRLRSFVDRFRAFDHKSQKVQARSSDVQKKLYDQWFSSLIDYFGYSHFMPDKVARKEGGHIPFYRAENDTHSVVFLCCSGPTAPHSAFDTGAVLTNIEGQAFYELDIKENLVEQVERFIQLTGRPDVLLFMPRKLYWFRADSRVSGQCLEVSLEDITHPEAEDSLCLATHLLESTFFAYEIQINESGATEQDDEEAEVGEDDEEGAPSATTDSIKANQAQDLFKEDLEQARAITEELHKQVTLALEFLCNERLDVDPELRKTALNKKDNEQMAHGLFKDGLFVLYRVLFVLYAEARGFLPTENERYASFYSMEHLRDWAENYLRQEKRGLAQPEGTYLWGALQGLFTLLRRGIELGGGIDVSPYNGQLFAPDQTPLFDHGPDLRDQAMARVLMALTKIGGTDQGRRLHFGNLGIEQLGAVYEALLAQKPVIPLEASEWVPAHGGGVALVDVSFADAMELERFEQNQDEARKKRRGKRGSAAQGLEKYIDPSRPSFRPRRGVFIVATMGGTKRQTASFYTPPKLAEFLVKRTLRPMVEGKRPEEICKLRIVEPAVGSGGFLIAAVRYLGEELLKSKLRHRVPGVENTKEELQRCKREIAESCLYGVDINPLSIELCRTSLYLECLVAHEPLPFLHHHLKSGDSLVGADFLGKRISEWEEGISFPALFDIPVDHLIPEKSLMESWSEREEAYGRAGDSEKALLKIKDKVKKLKNERKSIGSVEHQAWAISMQNSVNEFMQLARKAQEDFEKIQNSSDVVNALDARFKDHLSLVPDMDPVLIDAHGIQVSAQLERKRREALIKEHGKGIYSLMVERQRAFMRLKALGDLNMSLWFWPIEQFELFPSYQIYQELTKWLLDKNTLTPGMGNKRLSLEALKTLKNALRVAKKHKLFHWHVEFAQIFANVSKSGFDAVISNPPWKVVGVKDKEIYPQVDPQYMMTKPKDKKRRKELLYRINPHTANLWYENEMAAKSVSDLWRKGGVSPIIPEGKIDLCVLFVAHAENLVRNRGRKGLLVSRSSLLVNKATKSLREYYFIKGGWEESISFINHSKIFEIAGYIEFTIMVSESGSREKRVKHLHGISDVNALESADKALDDKSVMSGYEVSKFSIEDIRALSRESLAIPAIKLAKQLEIVRAILNPIGEAVFLDDITDPKQIKCGIDQTAGPKKGISEFIENIPSKELGDVVLKGATSKSKWVPLYRGRNFNLLQSKVLTEDGLSIKQCARRDKLSIDGENAQFVCWRAISQVGNQRSFVVSVIPRGYFYDNNVWGVMFKDEEKAFYLATMWSSIVIDFLSKTIGASVFHISTVNSFPVFNYRTTYLEKAFTLYKEAVNERLSEIEIDHIASQVDALIWLHVGAGKKPLDRSSLEWMLDTQFKTLLRHRPHYKSLVLEAYDKFISDSNLDARPHGTIFKKNKVLHVSAKNGDKDREASLRVSDRSPQLGRGR